MTPAPHRGFTLIELLVAVAILGVLIALCLTAVMHARETARRAQCASHLHNIGVALHQHQEARSTFPSGINGGSFLYKLLPYMEQEPLSRASLDSKTYTFPIPGTYVCPSDTHGSAMSRYATNYAGNADLLGHKPVTAWDGVFIDQDLSPRDIHDGLSRTVAVAEWIVGDGDDQHGSRLGSIHTLDVAFPDTEAGYERFADACSELDVPAGLPADVAFKGSYWFGGKLGSSLYTHALPPDRPSCVAIPGLNAITAGSFHGGGCHALFLDGSVRFVRNSVSRPVWRALGSRAGGEVVGEGAY